MKFKLNKIHVIAIVSLAVIFGMIFYQKIVAGIYEKIQREKMMMAPFVEVETVKEQEYAQKSESAGRIKAKYSVDVIARINGWLELSYFKEGAFVKKGQELFLIEPREYIIAVNQAQAAMRQAQATLVNAEKELVRAAELVKNDYVSKSYYDKALATRDQSKAAYDMRKAELDNAKRNLEYTKIVSPIDGKIGKIYITEGNFVTPSSGKIATIVSTDPIYAYYSFRSPDYVKFKRAEMNSKIKNDVKVDLKLADGEMYPYSGQVEFINNVVDETAGTIEMRAIFHNKENMLVPGDYVTVVQTVKTPDVYKVVPQKAVMKGSEFSYVFVVNDKNMASVRKVETGKQIGDKWAIVSGLDVGENVIISGLTNIHINPAGDPKNPMNQRPVQIDTSKQNQQPNKK